MDRLRRRGVPGRADGLARYRYAVAAIDQVGLSLFNFALNFSLLRLLSVTEFGIVSLWMAVALLAIGVQGALVSVPLNVQVTAAPDTGAAHRLEEALVTVNLLLIAAAGAAVALVGAIADAEWAAETPALAVAITLFVVAALYREYYRALAFSRRDMALLLVVDVPYIVVTASCIAAMLVWPGRFAGLTEAFLALSLGGAVSQLCVRLLIRRRAVRPFRPGWPLAYRTILGDVMWSFLGAVGTDVQSRSYVYITTSFVGLSGLAAINAVGVLFRPVRILMSAWGKSALPHLAALAAAGDRTAFDRAVLLPLIVGAVGSVAVWATLWFGWRPIEHYLFAEKYPAAIGLLLPWGLASGFNVIDYILGVSLTAVREFKFLAQAALLGAPVTAVATIVAVWWHGYAGAMYGVAFGTAAIAGAQATRLLSVRRQMGSAAPAAVAAGPVQILAEGDL